MWSRIGSTTWCTPAYPKAISDSTPAARTTRNSDATSTAYWTSVDFPMPAGPASTSEPPCPPFASARSVWTVACSAARPTRGLPALVPSTVATAAQSRRPGSLDDGIGVRRFGVDFGGDARGGGRSSRGAGSGGRRPDRRRVPGRRRRSPCARRPRVAARDGAEGCPPTCGTARRRRRAGGAAVRGSGFPTRRRARHGTRRAPSTSPRCRCRPRSTWE